MDREIDTTIAEKIFGLTVIRNPKGGWSIGEPDYYDSYGFLELANPVPCYTSDYNDAMLVWDMISFQVESMSLFTDDLGFILDAHCKNGELVRVVDKTLALVVCSLALELYDEGLL